jgi:hypothetical protein
MLSSLSVAGSGLCPYQPVREGVEPIPTTIKKSGGFYLLFLHDLYPIGWSPFLTGVAIFLCLLSSLQLAYLTQVHTTPSLATREY